MGERVSDDDNEPPIRVMVTTRNMVSGEVTERIVDHSVQKDRKWVGRHSYWAVRHGHEVTTTPIGGSDRDL